MDLISKIKFDGNYDNWFKSIASELMNNYVLKVNKKKYRLTELEFYYFKQKDHEDKHAHQHGQQLTSGQWYFHGSGLDITFGDKAKKIFGGILIRGIIDIKNYKYIDGSLKVVTEIFKQIESIDTHKIEFGLLRTPLEQEEQPVRTTRIGLNENTHPKFHKKLYRFIVEINSKHQFKEKTRVAKQMQKDGHLVDDINKKFGYKIIS